MLDFLQINLTPVSLEISQMRAAWGAMVAMGAFLIVMGISGSMVGDYLERYGTLFSRPCGEMNLAMATVDRMRGLIDQLRVR
jgi:hypothetical protein